MSFIYQRKISFISDIVLVGLVAAGGIVGGVTGNPVILGVISGTGLVLKTASEAKNYKRKIEMSKFAFTFYEKILTDIRSCMRGI